MVTSDANRIGRDSVLNQNHCFYSNYLEKPKISITFAPHFPISACACNFNLSFGSSKLEILSFNSYILI